MRTWRYTFLLFFVLIPIGAIVWCSKQGIIPKSKEYMIINQGKSAITSSPKKNNDPQLSNEQDLTNDSEAMSNLNVEIARYVLKENTYATQSDIANNVALSQKNLCKLCARRMETATDNERLALAHFVSAYYKRGPRQKEELMSLLHSDDIRLVDWLLELLYYTVDLGPNGEYQLDKPLGGAEIPPHITRIWKRHRELEYSVATVLNGYGKLAKSEATTLLRIALSDNKQVAFLASLYLQNVDDNLAKRFGFDENHRQITDEQRKEIEAYLLSQEH